MLLALVRDRNLPENKSKILLVGCGKMGTALLSGWLKSELVSSSEVIIIDPSPNFVNEHGIKHVNDFNELDSNYIPDIVLFAVKPQIMSDVVVAYKGLARKNTLFISIAAGKNIDFFENILGKESSIIRSMPNLPAIISQGVTVAFSNKNVNKSQELKCEELFNAVGSIIFIEDEGLMDAVTAISGSGPAYLFYFLESLIEAGIELGLSENIAKELAIKTVFGSAKLAEESNYSPSTLREKVTSPNGTTEAALKILMNNDQLKNIIKDAASGARDKSKDLDNTN